MNETVAEVHSQGKSCSENPTIPGLSTVPSIGKWLTSEELAQGRSAEGSADHISLVQQSVADHFSTENQSDRSAVDATSDSCQYEVLEIESNADAKGVLQSEP